MGKGGGPVSSTTVTSNIPEYARPYVENMLGAAEQQVFTTNAAGDYSGFRPYTPYSSNPQDYFAGPTGLQQQAYSEAAQMQTPGQFYTGTGLTGLAGLGQLGTTQQALGAGSQYASQVTNPNAIQAYMSPYQQGVTDVAKQAAIREAQLAQNQANLGAARQGTYGGARQALARSERERNLLSNLSNIQAQGSQQAYDRAIANMQYGSNLGLQGLSAAQQGLAGAAATGQGLAGIGASQQQADLARLNAQNTLGQGQQQYQQGIINQAIQDYATQQQYPMMQLSTLSSLLRGLPLQSTSTQQYQAQAPLAQQAAGLLGAYTAYSKAEGGTIKSYKNGGSVGLGYADRGVVDSMRDRLETMAETNPQGLKKLIASTSSKEVKEMGNEILSGIAMANTGRLGTNMAGGGIIAFNVPCDGAAAQEISKQFVEVLIAPSFSDEAKAIFAAKQNVRLLEIPLGSECNHFDFKRVGGGLLVQSPDAKNVLQSEMRVVSKRQPTPSEMNDMMFAWRVAKFVKSNAIVYCANGMTLGIGAGQMSRVDSARMASIKAENAGLSLQGSAVASDAFFPFRDGLDVVVNGGASCAIQPGGSMRDEEIIAAADEHGIAMIFTGTRHFRH